MYKRAQSLLGNRILFVGGKNGGRSRGEIVFSHMKLTMLAYYPI